MRPQTLHECLPPETTKKCAQYVRQQFSRHWTWRNERRCLKREDANELAALTVSSLNCSWPRQSGGLNNVREQELSVWGNQGLLWFTGWSTRGKKATQQEDSGDLQKVLFTYSVVCRPAHMWGNYPKLGKEWPQEDRGDGAQRPLRPGLTPVFSSQMGKHGDSRDTGSSTRKVLPLQQPLSEHGSSHARQPNCFQGT